MTDFTPEQLEAVETAMDKIFQSDMSHKEKLIAILTKPKPVFNLGEVVICSNQGEKEWAHIWCAESNTARSVRRPTPDEVPALALAIERLEEMQTSGATINNHLRQAAETALDDIKSMYET